MYHMCIDIYIYIYTHTHTYIHIYVYIYVCIYIGGLAVKPLERRLAIVFESSHVFVSFGADKDVWCALHRLVINISYVLCLLTYSIDVYLSPSALDRNNI